ncbi:hypothetical protein [Anatilimnocola floriformis]|uniref:hypothetical protein n=1 Tax=Anatilimnocola floriformis TaxID=2948575 RepID=UPI0020C36455|nr:hypothetical protein [Anatilimnocola floriformis]
MSNTSVIERIRTLADQLDAGEADLAAVRDSLLSYVDALEGIGYGRVKEAQYVWAQLANGLEAGTEINTEAVVGWLREWSNLVSQEISK